MARAGLGTGSFHRARASGSGQERAKGWGFTSLSPRVAGVQGLHHHVATSQHDKRGRSKAIQWPQHIWLWRAGLAGQRRPSPFPSVHTRWT